MLNKITIQNLSADYLCHDYADINLVVTRNVEVFTADEMPLLNKVYLIIYCINGNGLLSLNKRIYAFKNGEICICKPTSKIRLSVFTKHPKYFIIAIKTSYFNQLLRRHKDSLQFSDLTCNPICNIGKISSYKNKINRYVEIIIDEVKRQSDYFKSEIIHNSVLPFLFTLFLYMKEKEEIERDRRLIRDNVNDVAYKLFRTELYKSNGKLRSYHEYADFIGCSTNFLSSCLIQKTSKDAFQHIEDVTLEEAKKLLRCSSMSIKEICSCLNFPNITCFSSFIKKHLGFTPSEFRKNSTKQQ